MKNFITSTWNRLRFWVCGIRRTRTTGQFAADLDNLKAEGYTIVMGKCISCGHIQQSAIFPENVTSFSECGRCHLMTAEVTTVFL